MIELLFPYLTVVGWVLGPVVLGMIWSRIGAPASASRRLFNFAFYGCQTIITLCSLWIARVPSMPQLVSTPLPSGFTANETRSGPSLVA